jgi:hypothetical protein
MSIVPTGPVGSASRDDFRHPPANLVARAGLYLQSWGIDTFRTLSAAGEACRPIAAGRAA